MLLRIILALAFAGYAGAADCIIPDTPMVAVQGYYFVYAPRGPVDYKACYFNASFTIVADSGDPTISLGKININNFAQFGGIFTLSIYDGADLVESFNPDTLTPDIINKLQNYKSKTTTLSFKEEFSTTATTGTLSCIFYPIDGRVTEGTTPSRPPTTTPVPFTNPDVPYDPAFVNTDLAIAWVSTGSDSVAFEQMRSTISYTAQFLTFTTDPESKTGSRLSLQSLNKVPVVNNIGIPWEYTQSDFLANVNTLQTATSETALWTEAIEAFLLPDGFFDPEQSKTFGSRRTAQRVYAFFTQTDFDLSEDTKIRTALQGLLTYDVHMVVVNYNQIGLPNWQQIAVDFAGQNFALLNYKQGSPYEFLANYITTSDRPATGTSFGCAPKLSAYDISTTDSGLVQIPPNRYGTTGRYCNQMDSSITFNTTADRICFTINKYELEVEQDWVKFYSVNETGAYEQVVLNGIDVSQSKFEITESIAKVQFLSNSDTVLGGIEFMAKSGAC